MLTSHPSLCAKADKLGFYGSQFLGYQDTVYANSGTQYYSKCYIEGRSYDQNERYQNGFSGGSNTDNLGAADYIYGDASAWISESDIVSNDPGYITAMGRETEDDPSWYVFDSCSIYGKEGSDLTEQVYLGRPWRVFARVTYQNSELSDIIHPEGWTTLAENATPLYYEYNNTGDGSDTSDRLYTSEVSEVTTIETVLGEDYADWVDTSF